LASAMSGSGFWAGGITMDLDWLRDFLALAD
jgi:hypothetical protein